MVLFNLLQKIDDFRGANACIFLPCNHTFDIDDADSVRTAILKDFLPAIDTTVERGIRLVSQFR